MLLPNILKNHVPGSWNTKDDFPIALWTDWESGEYSYLNRDKMVPEEFCIEHSQFETKLIKKTEFEVMIIKEQLALPHLFILTDSNGIVLDLWGEDSLHWNMKPLKIKKGNLISLQSTGINALSLSIQTGKRIFLTGSEHQPNVLHNWNCLSSPVYVKDVVIAYINFNFFSPHVLSTSFALMTFLVKHIERELENERIDEIHLHKVFNTYQLTEREKSVAIFWLHNKGALYISAELGITEGTVRNFVKKIYSKCNVRDRVSFIQKFHN